MAEQLPGDQVRGRVTAEFRTTSDVYAANFRTINRAIAQEFVRALDGETPVDPPAVDPRRELFGRQAAEAEQSLPGPGETVERLGGQLPEGEVDRAEAVRRVVAKWAPLLDPGHPAVAAYLTRLVEEFPEIQAALTDGGVDLGLDDVEP